MTEWLYEIRRHGKKITEYVKKGTRKEVLKSFAGIGVGFDEGDVEIIKD